VPPGNFSGDAKRGRCRSVSEPVVLTVIFQRPSDFLAQEAHLARGALFVPVPEPAPEPFQEIVVRVEGPGGEPVESVAQVLEITPAGMALAFRDLDGARRALAPLFDAARTASEVEGGATWVFWGRQEAVVEETEDAPAPSQAGALAAADEPSELLYEQIRAMSGQEKMRLALKGDRPTRLVLLKDVNKNLQTFLIQNPRITLDEIRWLAASRQTSPDVLHSISQHREWGQNAGSVSALIHNPKTPPTTAVKLLEKLPMSEIRRLARTGEAPRAVTIAARKKCAS